MNFNKVHTIYFLGIGGIGMSALARYFKLQGKDIYGYDLTPSPLTQQLESEGIQIHYEADISKIPEQTDLVIHTPAVPITHDEYQYFVELGIPIYKRAKIIGLLSEGEFTIAVAGTHGKTSICAITAHMIKSAGQNITALVGGMMKNYNSNLIVSDPTDYLLLEADEFDRSFLEIKPDIALISSMDADHLDIYGHHDELRSNFVRFAELLNEDGILITHSKLDGFGQLDLTKFRYGINMQSDYRAENIRISEGRFVFDLVSPNLKISNIKMNIPGEHYVENAVAASAIGLQVGLTSEEIKNGLESFTGVERRFELRINEPNCVFVDDYAHHPEEIKVTVKALKSLFPEKKITGIFQPHLYSRTRDFADDFAESLETLDEIILLDIYPAREEPIPGVDSEMILSRIKNPDKKLLKKEELFKQLQHSKPEVVLTMGAGDIGLMADKIESILKK